MHAEDTRESPPTSNPQDLERGLRSGLNIYRVIFRIEYIYLTNRNCPTNWIDLINLIFLK